MLEQFGNVMEMIKRIQQNMEEVNDTLRNQIIEVSSGDTIKVKINGQQTIMSIEINPTFFTPDNATLIGDLLTATINNAWNQSREAQQNAMAKLASDYNLPKIPGLF